MTKNRALVSGSGKKPWRQKGTGRARVGETRNPLWRHGGTVFGPQPRDYSYSMPKKARAAALRAALSQRLQRGRASRWSRRFAVEEPEDEGAEGPARRRWASPARRWSSTTSPTDALVLSGRNLPGVKVVADVAPDRLRRAGLQAPAGLPGGARQARGAAHAARAGVGDEEPLRRDPPSADHREVHAPQGDAAHARASRCTATPPSPRSRRRSRRSSSVKVARRAGGPRARQGEAAGPLRRPAARTGRRPSSSSRRARR